LDFKKRFFDRLLPDQLKFSVLELLQLLLDDLRETNVIVHKKNRDGFVGLFRYWRAHSAVKVRVVSVSCNEFRGDGALATILGRWPRWRGIRRVAFLWEFLYVATTEADSGGA
jgi:hypothetical protein